MRKESSGAGATAMKTKSSGAGAMFMKKRAPKLCHFYDGSAALITTKSCLNCWNPSDHRCHRLLCKNHWIHKQILLDQERIMQPETCIISNKW